MPTCLARLALVALLLAAPAAAEPLSTDPMGCGGDAYSSAQVTEGRPPRRGPLVAMPDTLCADLAAPPNQTRIEIYGLPGVGDRMDGIGEDEGDAPYEGRLRPPPRRGD